MGTGIRCGTCLSTFKSYLRLQHHRAQVHGETNQMSRWSKNDIASIRKENLHYSEELLKREISRYKYYK